MAVGIKFQLPAAFTHPPDLPRGIAHDQRVGRDVVRHHRAGSDQGVTAYRVAAYDGRIGTDAGSAFDARLAELVLAGDGAAGIDDIRKDAARAEEHVVLARDAGVDRDVVLYLHPVSDAHAGRNYHVLPDAAMRAHRATRHEVREMPHARAFADGAAGVDYCRGVYFILFHISQITYRLRRWWAFCPDPGACQPTP